MVDFTRLQGLLGLIIQYCRLLETSRNKGAGETTENLKYSELDYLRLVGTIETFVDCRENWDLEQSLVDS